MRTQRKEEEKEKEEGKKRATNVSDGGKDGTVAEVGLEEVKHGLLGVGDEVVGKVPGRVVGDHISGVQAHIETLFTGHDFDTLEGGHGERPGRVAVKVAPVDCRADECAGVAAWWGGGEGAVVTVGAAALAVGAGCLAADEEARVDVNIGKVQDAEVFTLSVLAELGLAGVFLGGHLGLLSLAPEPGVEESRVEFARGGERAFPEVDGANVLGVCAVGRGEIGVAEDLGVLGSEDGGCVGALAGGVGRLVLVLFAEVDHDLGPGLRVGACELLSDGQCGKTLVAVGVVAVDDGCDVGLDLVCEGRRGFCGARGSGVDRLGRWRAL